MQRLATVFALVMLAASVAPVIGHGAGSGSMHIAHPWARATAGVARNGVAYLTIVNRGREADRLVSVTSPVARKAALHNHIVEGDIVKMRPVEAITVHPGTPAVLKPGGLHIMLMGLHAPLMQGQTFVLTLTFEQAGTVDVEVAVEKPGAMAPTHRQGKSESSVSPTSE